MNRAREPVTAAPNDAAHNERCAPRSFACHRPGTWRRAVVRVITTTPRVAALFRPPGGQAAGSCETRGEPRCVGAH